jgi:hypothetical protein
MRYDEFRDRWLAALRGSRVLSYQDRPEETVNLTTMGRRWEVHVIGRSAEPFHPAATVGFDWDPFASARSYTCEEDLLTDLYGRRAARSTQPRLVRVDFAFRAALTWGSTIPLPAAEVRNPWAKAVQEKLDEALAVTRRRKAPGTMWRGELELEGAAAPDGSFALNGISSSSGELIVIPRVWDDNRRQEREGSAAKRIDELAARIRKGLDAWLESVDELARWLRYAPDAGPASPRRRPSSAGGRRSPPDTTH